MHTSYREGLFKVFPVVCSGLLVRAAAASTFHGQLGPTNQTTFTGYRVGWGQALITPGPENPLPTSVLLRPQRRIL